MFGMICIIGKEKKSQKKKEKSGDAGFRSRYLPHAKRTRYQIRHTPISQLWMKLILNNDCILTFVVSSVFWHVLLFWASTMNFSFKYSQFSEKRSLLSSCVFWGSKFLILESFFLINIGFTKFTFFFSLERKCNSQRSSNPRN